MAADFVSETFQALLNGALAGKTTKVARAQLQSSSFGFIELSDQKHGKQADIVSIRAVPNGKKNSVVVRRGDANMTFSQDTGIHPKEIKRFISQ